MPAVDRPIIESHPAIESQPAIDSHPSIDLETLRVELAQSSKQLNRLIDKDWQRYLELPDEVENRGKHASVRSLAAAAGRYDAVADDARYRALSDRPEFQTTHEWLRAYLDALGSQDPNRLALPPPPGGR